MSDGTVKELKRRDANNHWSVKLFVVNGEEQWWVENGERNIALATSREDAEHIAEAHNKFRGAPLLLQKKFFSDEGFRTPDHPITFEVRHKGEVVSSVTYTSERCIGCGGEINVQLKCVRCGRQYRTSKVKGMLVEVEVVE